MADLKILRYVVDLQPGIFLQIITFTPEKRPSCILRSPWLGDLFMGFYLNLVMFKLVLCQFHIVNIYIHFCIKQVII